MSLINPGFATVIWMTLAFGVTLFVLAKYAWKPIMASLKEREDSIEVSLRAAEEARNAMENLKLDNQKLLRDAKDERDALLKDARMIKEQIIEGAKTKANAEGANIIEAAKERIEDEKNAAVVEIKNTIASYSIIIAEKILKEELKDKKKQENYAEKMLKEISLN